MHELALANSVLEAVQAEAAKRPGARLRQVGLRVGELAGVDPEALQFAFTVLVQGTDLEPLAIEIQTCPRRQRCPQCGQEFVVIASSLVCPRCGQARTKLCGGDELDLVYLEVDEP
jgi:hydrogenase nickel incorporation protein HypA/HybF